MVCYAVLCCAVRCGVVWCAMLWCAVRCGGACLYTRLAGLVMHVNDVAVSGDLGTLCPNRKKRVVAETPLF